MSVLVSIARRRILGKLLEFRFDGLDPGLRKLIHESLECFPERSHSLHIEILALDAVEFQSVLRHRNCGDHHVRRTHEPIDSHQALPCALDSIDRLEAHLIRFHVIALLEILDDLLAAQDRSHVDLSNLLAMLDRGAHARHRAEMHRHIVVCCGPGNALALGDLPDAHSHAAILDCALASLEEIFLLLKRHLRSRSGFVGLALFLGSGLLLAHHELDPRWIGPAFDGKIILQGKFAAFPLPAEEMIEMESEDRKSSELVPSNPDRVVVMEGGAGLMNPASIIRAAKIEQRSVESLEPYSKNPRTHSDDQIEKIVRSIIAFGFTNPILVDGGNGIIAGHGRLAAAKRLGMESVPVIELSHLTPAQKRAYVIADNRLALEAGWDEALLKEEIEALRDEDFDLSLTGFNDPEISGILLEKEFGETDPHAEWTGMPDYDQSELPSYHKVMMRFASAEDMAAFARLIDQTISQRTHNLWYPRRREQEGDPQYE